MITDADLPGEIEERIEEIEDDLARLDERQEVLIEEINRLVDEHDRRDPSA